MHLLVSDVASNNRTDKTKLPEFGFYWKDIQSGTYTRIGYVQYLELHKIPVENCIPTKYALGGIGLDQTERNRIATAFAQHETYGKDVMKAASQMSQICKLLTIRFKVRSQTVNNYPFCKIDLLTEEQLAFINTTLKLSIEYEAYCLFMENLFTKETLKKLYRDIGVSDIPEFTLGSQTTTSSTQETESDLIELFKQIQQQQ